SAELHARPDEDVSHAARRGFAHGGYRRSVAKRSAGGAARLTGSARLPRRRGRGRGGALFRGRRRASRPSHADRQRVQRARSSAQARTHAAAEDRPRMTRERDAALTLIIEDERWRKQKAALRLMRRAAMIALKNRARGATRRSVTILLSDGRRLRQLNSQFRGRDKATNVLSFNARDDSYLGDIAI